jgi:hypothetical protein
VDGGNIWKDVHGSKLGLHSRREKKRKEKSLALWVAPLNSCLTDEELFCFTLRSDGAEVAQ